jgi:ESCRT-II complex subunit VPS22
LDILEALLKEGLAMVDDGAPGGERLYWFPALSGGSSGGGGAQGLVAVAAAAAATG